MPQPRQAALQVQLHPIMVPDRDLARSLEGFRQEVQQYLQQLAERADTLSGLRGTPAFYADLDARGNKVRGLGIGDKDDDAAQRGQALTLTADGKAYDAKGRKVVNLALADSDGNGVPWQQLQERLKQLLNSPTFTGTVTIARLVVTGPLEHSGTTVGFLGATPAVQQAAIAALTDGTGATANNAIENVPAAAGDAGGAATVSAANAVATVTSVNTALTAIENNIADLTAKVNALAAVVRTFGFIAP